MFDTTGLNVLVEMEYKVAFKIWNVLVCRALELLQTSPSTASDGTTYQVAYSLYSAITSAAVPLATVFFIIGIYKSVVSTPADQQFQRFVQDLLRYAIILVLIADSWNIFSYIMELCDGITSVIGTTNSYELTLSNDLLNLINEEATWPDFELSTEYIKSVFSMIICYCILAFAAGATLCTYIASSMLIISCAFERVIKPLIVLPFAGIAVSLGAGGGEIARSLHQFIKTFFGLCISGAVMIIAIKLGITLATNLVSIDFSDASGFEQVLIMSIQCAITPIVVSGLVKGSENLVSRMF